MFDRPRVSVNRPREAVMVYTLSGPIEGALTLRCPGRGIQTLVIR
jgi:hypothetical protein